MMSSFKANGLGTISLGNGRYYIGPFINGKFDTTGKDVAKSRERNCTKSPHRNFFNFHLHFELQGVRPSEFM